MSFCERYCRLSTMKYFTFLILAFFILPFSAIHAQSIQAPKSYAECMSSETAHISKAPAECRYHVAADKAKANDEISKKYISCEIFKSGYRFLKDYECNWIDNGTNQAYPRKVECVKPNSAPIFLYPEGGCTLLFFDTDYKFPETYAECQREPQHGLLIPEAEPNRGNLCAISIKGAGLSGSDAEWYDIRDAEALLKKCLTAGGIPSALPQCDVYYQKQ